MKPLLAAILCAALALAGCSLRQSIEPPSLYAVEPVPGPAAVKQREGVLRIGSVRMAPAFSSNELVYRLDEIAFTQDFYNRFLSPPGAMLGVRVSDWLARSGPYAVVVQPSVGAASPLVLEAVFTELYGDFRSGGRPAAVMTVQFYVLDVTGTAPKVVLDRVIGRRVALERAGAPELVRGYNVALGEILTELAAALPPAPGR
jgi:cholesterol transport system auxiliary component